MENVLSIGSVLSEFEQSVAEVGTRNREGAMVCMDGNRGTYLQTHHQCSVTDYQCGPPLSPQKERRS
jgi:hypothetical protein